MDKTMPLNDIQIDPSNVPYHSEFNNDTKEINNNNNLNTSYTLSWKDLSYTVQPKKLFSKEKSKIKILQNVSGRIGPNEFLACMGPSGSGKTTLLDILADRISSGTIEGTIFINGTLRNIKTYRRIASYVSQEDSLMGSFTVLETLRFAARLSLPSNIKSNEKEKRIQNAIDNMGLRTCEHTMVGDLFRKGISGGQKRRLSIAIELISEPNILLLDEPTSGLDSSSTFNVIKCIKNISNTNRTIICTIHQPSYEVYNMFTKIMLLVKGKTIFYGTQKEALKHFELLNYPCPMYCNPAEYFVNLINTDFDHSINIELAIKTYNESNEYKLLIEQIDHDLIDLKNKNQIDLKEFQPSSLNQFMMLMHRNTLNNIRNPGIYWVRLFMYFCLSFMVGTMYLRTNKDITDSDRVPLLFYVQAFLVFMAVAVLPFFIEQRGVFSRERANHSLNVFSYVFANFFSTLPGIFMIAILSSILVVYLANLNSFSYFLLNLFLSLIVAESMMHVIGSAVPHYIIGIALGAGIFGMFMLCEGFMVPYSSIPNYWIWGYYLAFHTYSFKTFLHKQYKNINTIEGLAIRKKYELDDVNSNLNMIILVIYAIILQIIFSFILWKFHTGRR